MSLAEKWLSDELMSQRDDLVKHARGVGSQAALKTLAALLDLLVTDKQIKLFANEQQHSKGLVDGLKLAKGEIEAALAATS